MTVLFRSLGMEIEVFQNPTVCVNCDINTYNHSSFLVGAFPSEGWVYFIFQCRECKTVDVMKMRDEEGAEFEKELEYAEVL